MQAANSSIVSSIKKRVLPLALAAATGLATVAWQPVIAAEKPQQIEWDLTDIYEDKAAWQAAADDVRARIAELPKLKKGLGKNAKSLADTLEQISAVRKELVRVYIYTSLDHDADQRDAEAQELFATSRALGTEFGEAVSWLDPALLALGEKKVKKYLKKEPRLAPFDFYLESLFDSAEHLLDEQGEALLAAAGAVVSAPNGIYELLANADVPWPEVTLSNGDTVLLNQAGYSRTRGLENRDDRKMVFDTFWAVWQDYQDSLFLL